MKPKFCYFTSPHLILMGFGNKYRTGYSPRDTEKQDMIMHTHILSELSEVRGLTSAEASRRLKAEGYNELPASGKRSVFAIILNVFSEPMFGLLIAASGVYFLIGELRDAVILSLFAMLSVMITVVQEWRSEKVLETLRDLTSPRALVERDGEIKRIEGRQVVRGDLLVLAEGDRVPADARLVSSDVIMTDESLLTGESVPINKHVGEAQSAEMVFSGTLIVRGSAKAIVTATGIRSEIGKIGKALSELEVEPPRLRQQTRKIVKIFASIGLSVSVLNVLLYGFLRDNWMDGLLSGIALGMSLLPEEFPLVLSVFMVMGAWRISKANVLTRQGSAIETLGSATVLCTDKTGTLTQNKMSIAYLNVGDFIWSAGDDVADIQPELRYLLFSGMRASKKISYDPMDMAFFQSAFVNEESVSDDMPEHHYGIRPELLMMAQVFKQAGGGEGYEVFAKGAPEAIAKACRMDKDEADGMYREVEALGQRGLRVLAVAVARTPDSVFPESADAFSYRFLGLVGFADPLRDNVREAVSDCRAAGIRVVMITGDFPTTAQAIAQQAGMDYAAVLVGDDVEKMDDARLQAAVRQTHIFARITPHQKLRIVNALKANGDVVAMTGDGVNDAPSLKAAHIGVAMGLRGTDVAREASSIVLLDDNFASLVRTIALGRRIFDNLQKAMIYIVAVHIPIAGLALLPLIFNMPLILTPLLIALMEMVIDPACSIVLEAEKEEANAMKRPPRNPADPILSGASFIWGGVQGGVSFIALGVVWFIAFQNHVPEDDIRSLVFISLLVINLMLILTNRTFSASILEAFQDKNPVLGWGALGIICIFGLILFLPISKELFGLGDIHGHDIAYALGAGLLSLIILEALKPIFIRQNNILKKADRNMVS